ncbi:MAG: hypothetical protein IJ960_06780 [Oscillospiraceae bacterium]|nr:hypothetical protein [Oscillospiraceae bacterium]
MTAREIADLFAQLELHLIESLRRNLSRHKRQEEDEGGVGGVPERWEAWQAAKLRDIRRFRRENRAILGEYQSVIDAETEALLREQYAEGGSQGFFHTSDERLRSLIEQMQGNEARAERAALRYMDDVYRKTVLRTATAMTAGGMTLQKATDEATRDFLAQGINCIQYANGRRVNIASYAEMALRTCSTRAMLMGEARQRAKIGVNTVLVSQYGACSDTCLPWQGKVYIDDVFQEYNGPRGGSFGVSLQGRQYLFLSVAIKAGLFHPNCRHTITTWIEGVSRMPEPMDPAQIEKVSQLEKQQRRMELNVRKAKREAAGLTDPEAVKEANRRVRARQKVLREFVAEHGDVLRRDYWRERDDGIPKDWGTIDRLDLSFSPNSRYQKIDGEFDIDEAKSDYSNFLTSVPEKNRIYLEQSFSSVGYQERALPNAAFGYSAKYDTVFYDISKPDFWRMDFRTVNTHELAHRIDRLFVNAESNVTFQSVIRNAKTIVQAQPDIFERYCYEKDEQGFVSDILSAITEGECDLPMGHSAKYWNRQGAKEREVFANLFSLETFADHEKLDFIREHFPDLYEAYKALEFEVS